VRVQKYRAVAKAWLNFDGSGTGTYGTPVVRSHYNIDEVRYLDPGKYRITLKPNVAVSGFAVFGTSNSRVTAASQEDFARNTVGITQRTIDASGRAVITFLVLNEAGQYVDGEINDMVVFGYNQGETSNPSPTIVSKS
jgi:hypothetical protein